MQHFARAFPLWLIGGICFAIGLASPLRGDVIVLRQGGEVRGQITSDRLAEGNRDVTIRTLTGALLTIPRSEIESLSRRRMVYEEYEQLRRQTADTVAAQWELAEWCRRKELPDRRQTHLRRMIELEPDHAAARKGLGYSFQEGRWVTQDEIMTARGYLKYKGKYVLQQELELLLREQRESDAEKAWYRKVKMWYGWANDPRPERREEGVRSLKEIRDANAIPALYRTFSNDAHEESRLFYISILAGVGDERTLGPLLTQSLQDSSLDVRHAAVKAMFSLDFDMEKALAVYVKSLQNEANVVVNRAGYALGELTREADYPRIIPNLINALVTTHKYRVRVPDKNSGISIRSDGQFATAGTPIPPDIAVMLATGQLPFGIQVQEVYPPGQSLRMKVITVQRQHENTSVLNALTKLTGQDFGPNPAAWQAWWSSAEATPSRAAASR